MKTKLRSLGVALLALLTLSRCGYNQLQGLDENVKSAWAEVENQYKRRSDLVPNLVNTVKGYAKQEATVLKEVTEARARATQITLTPDNLSDPAKLKAFQDAQSSLGSAMSRLLVSVEKYPDLKSNQNFRDLQAQIEGTENRIAVARKRYIDSVAEYNKGVRYFPTNLTAKFLLHLNPRETFQAAESDKAVPQVNFN